MSILSVLLVRKAKHFKRISLTSLGFFKNVQAIQVITCLDKVNLTPLVINKKRQIYAKI